MVSEFMHTQMNQVARIIGTFKFGWFEMFLDRIGSLQNPIFQVRRQHFAEARDLLSAAKRASTYDVHNFFEFLSLCLQNLRAACPQNWGISEHPTPPLCERHIQRPHEGGNIPHMAPPRRTRLSRNKFGRVIY